MNIQYPTRNVQCPRVALKSGAQASSPSREDDAMNILERRIRKAFSCTDSLDSLSSEDAKELNYEITALDNASVARLLPLLMMKEMYDDSRKSGDHLVYFLDGALLKRDKLGNLVPRNEKINAERYRFKNEDFKDFTKEQARVIVRWLKQVATPKYKNLCSVHITSAITYWREKYGD